MQLRILFIIALIIGIAVSLSLDRLHRSRIEHMILGLLCITAGGVVSLNPNISSIIRVSSIGVTLVFLGFVVGILGFFKRES